MEDAAFHKRMGTRIVEPLEKRLDKRRHLIRRRREMDDISGAVHDANRLAAKCARLLDKPSHHQLVNPKKVFHPIGINLLDLLVRRRRAKHFVDFLLGRDDLLALQHSGNLLLGKRIAFNGSRSANRLDAACLSEARRCISSLRIE